LVVQEKSQLTAQAPCILQTVVESLSTTLLRDGLSKIIKPYAYGVGMARFLTVLFFILPTLVKAADVKPAAVPQKFLAKIVYGSVYSDNQKITKNLPLSPGTLVESKDDKAFLQIQSESLKFALKGMFQFQIPEENKNSEWIARLMNGQMRVYKTKGVNDLRVTTPAAVTGVRGTDFFISYLPLLGETEVICFESKIDFSTLAGKSLQHIKASQWGGHGGRFGSTINTPITLLPAVLEHFDKNLAFQETNE